MALVKCRECGGPVSTTATACPKCGAKPRQPTSMTTWIIGGLFVLMVAVMVFSPSKREQPPAADSSQSVKAAAAVKADFDMLAKRRQEREEAYAPVRAKVNAEMKRLLSTRKYEEALKYGDPYFDVADPDFRSAYEQASKGVTAETEARAKSIARTKGVTLGMTQEEVLGSNWGKPRKVNRTIYSFGVHEQWVYDGGYLYFENGILKTIQN